EKNYVRAVRGGMGYTKTAGNYAASLKAQDEAEKQDYTQVLWLDGVERKYIEEVGTMNVFFVIGDEVVTPELQGSILPGITRMSAIELLKSWGMNVVERKLSIDELAQAAADGKLKEAFGTGTAAVISPIGHLKWGDTIMNINNGEIGPISHRLYDTLTGIQWGKIKDTFGWTVEVK
ncbi:MAG: branched chain amino acid aminotransferase, partial [Clostridiales bacterium]|nr:branched chain amino acid aminotransferase [Clostridiales bacterium]